MNKSSPLSSFVALALATTALVISTSALAQSTDDAPDTSDAVLEEIIVTAQKVAQQYLEVPVAVSTVTGEVLDMAKVTQFKDLVQVSPSVTYNQTGDQRGVGVRRAVPAPALTQRSVGQDRLEDREVELSRGAIAPFFHRRPERAVHVIGP